MLINTILVHLWSYSESPVHYRTLKEKRDLTRKPYGNMMVSIYKCTFTEM